MTTDTLPCGHPTACLRDGACGWCQAVQDARLHIEERDAAIQARERVMESGVRGVSDDGLLGCWDGHAVLWHEGDACPACALAAHVARLREALSEPRPTPDSVFSPLVRDLCERIGYGVVMTMAAALWREMLERSGGGGGEFYVGPCVKTVERLLAATPAVSLDHDRRVRAEAIRSVAQEIQEQDDYTVGETLSRAEASRVAGWIGARAAAIERGEP